MTLKICPQIFIPATFNNSTAILVSKDFAIDAQVFQLSTCVQMSPANNSQHESNRNDVSMFCYGNFRPFELEARKSTKDHPTNI